MAAAVLGCSSLATGHLLASPPWPAADESADHALTAPHPENPSGELYELMRESALGALYQAPAVGGLLSYIGALILPAQGKTPEQMWREYTDKRISETVFELVKADLEGLTNVSRLYRDAVAAQDTLTIHSQSIASNTEFAALIPRFQLNAEKIALLPLFATAATLHLALLRDIALKGREVGFSAESVQSYKRELSNRIDAYTRHVDQVVEAAIAKARQDNPNRDTPATRNQPLSAMLAEKARLQLEVIDQRDTWYAFDAEKYPDRKSVWLLREIFSPIAGWWDLESRAPDQIPDWKTPGTRINRLEVWIREQWRTEWLSALALHYDQTAQTLQTGEIWGERTEMSIDPSFWFKSARTSFGAGVALLSLEDSHGRTHKVGRDPEPNEVTVESGYAKHGMQSIRSVGKGSHSGAAKGAISGLAFGFGLDFPGPTRIQPEAESRIIPVIAPHLVDWVRRPLD